MHRIAAVLVCFIAWHAHAQSLSLEDAQRRALARSQQLAAQDSAIAAAREMAVSAGQLPDPVLKLGIDNLPVSGEDRWSLTRDFMTMRRIGVMQELTRSEKRELRAERFGREADKAREEKAAAVAAIQRSAALAWLDRYYAEAMQRVIEEQIGQARREIAAAEAAYRGGRGSQADAIAAYGTLAALEDRAAEFRRKGASARAMLARWIGDGADAPLAPRPPIDAVRIDLQNVESDLAHHPEIAMLARAQDVAATEAKIAQAARTPDWSVEVAYQQRGSDFGNMVSFGVSVPLPWDRGNRQDREVAAKLAAAEQARAQREELLRAHVGEVRALLAEWQSDRERLARYEGELIPLAAERSRAALAAYQGGRAALTELLLARRNETEVRMQAVQLEMETARTWAQLDFLAPHTGGAQ